MRKIFKMGGEKITCFCIFSQKLKHIDHRRPSEKKHWVNGGMEEWDKQTQDFNLVDVVV